MKTIAKKIVLLIFSAHLFLLTTATEKIKTDEFADCTNYVLIQGNSNINKFEFVNLNPVLSKDTNTKDAFSSEKDIQIPVHEFSGDNKMMLNDFFKMLNVDEYPFIKIEIESRNTADFDETTGLTNFKAKISIAGQTQIYEVPCELKTCEKYGFTINGNLKVELSDFKIEPPKKVFGAVKVDDEVFIKFAFRYL